MPLVIDNNQILNLLSNQKLVAEFPLFLISQEVSATCCKKANREPNYTVIKNCIANLSPEDQLKFKTLCGVDSVTVYVPTADGVKTVTF